MTDTVKINFSPNPVQRGFIESRATADLFSSRVGEGKSAALAWSIYYHSRHNPKARWLVVRDTMENLRNTTMLEFFKWFQPGVFGNYHQTHRLFTWASGVAEGEVEFIGLDDPNDAGKLQSRFFAGMALDEAAPSGNSGGIPEMIFDLGFSRLRQSDMHWYAMKVAENNPDESHWTYRRFVVPGTEGFSLWHPNTPENAKNLPANYYSGLRRLWAHRPDLIRRFLDGQFGFQQIGKAVTPEWDDTRHLAVGLAPLRGRELVLLWDFGHNPTCIVTQVTPHRTWNILDAITSDDMGVEELIDAAVRPMLAHKYHNFSWSHIGDPAGTTGDQSSIRMTPVHMIRKMIGGKWRSGPVRTYQRVEPLRAILRQNIGPTGLVQVDREFAAAVWHALRGGWHYHVARTGIVSVDPVKNDHSHPGDAMGYGAAVLFPLARLQNPRSAGHEAAPMSAWTPSTGALGFEQPGRRLPKEARKIG